MANLRLEIGCTQQQLLEAQRLRFEIFNLEMNAGLASSSSEGIDQDKFDQICEHVVIIDEKSHSVIGTYRMLLGDKAVTNGGFYAEKEFDLEKIKILEGGLLEVGRSCIRKEYRKKSVLSLLWQGIAQYAMAHQVRYIFGCASVFTLDPKEINANIRMFKKLNFYRDMGIFPRQPHNLDDHEGFLSENPQDIYEQLPVLFKGYLNLGLKVCSPPVFDREFKTTDFFILLDIKDMNKVYKKRLFGDYLDEEPCVEQKDELCE